MTDVEDLDMTAVERELTTLAGHLAAAGCRFLLLLAAFDAGGGWHGTGMRTCAQWLFWRCGLSTTAAREQLRVARALDALPVTRAAYAEGRLSFSKVRALTRVATAHTERDLVATATAATASQLDRLCAGIARARTSAEVLETAGRASFTARWEPDGTLRFTGRLPAEEGAALLAALAAVRPDPVADGVRGFDDDGETGAPSAADVESGATSVRRPDAAALAARSDAEALAVIARHALAQPPAAADSAPVRLVVHTSAEALIDNGEPSEPSDQDGTTVGLLDAGPGIPPVPLGPHTLRRLACQALVEPAEHPDQARPTQPRHRFATARQRRALLLRDGGCAFPGCPHRRGLHAHHVRTWHAGGPTTMDNLVLVCRHHHLLVHEGGWRLRRGDDHRWEATAPGGEVLRPAPTCLGHVGHLPTTRRARITPTTVGGSWSGQPLHLDYAVAVHTQPIHTQPIHTRPAA